MGGVVVVAAIAVVVVVLVVIVIKMKASKTGMQLIYVALLSYNYWVYYTSSYSRCYESKSKGSLVCVGFFFNNNYHNNC